MGVDCTVKVDDAYFSLDRWYVFDSIFVSGEVMSKSDALAKIRKLNNKTYLIKETIVWGDRRRELRKYYRYWIQQAKMAIKNSNKGYVVFLNDNDLPDDYWMTGVGE